MVVVADLHARAEVARPDLARDARDLADGPRELLRDDVRRGPEHEPRDAEREGDAPRVRAVALGADRHGAEALADGGARRDGHVEVRAVARPAERGEIAAGRVAEAHGDVEIALDRGGERVARGGVAPHVGEAIAEEGARVLDVAHEREPPAVAPAHRAADRDAAQQDGEREPREELPPEARAHVADGRVLAEHQDASFAST